MKVQDVMTRSVKSCGPDTNLAQAAAIMWENDCGVLPIVAEGGQVIGILTDRDIAIALGTQERVASTIPVIEVMSVGLHSCSPIDDIHAALKTMSKEKI